MKVRAAWGLFLGLYLGAGLGLGTGVALSVWGAHDSVQQGKAAGQDRDQYEGAARMLLSHSLLFFCPVFTVIGIIVGSTIGWAVAELRGASRRRPQ